jgi:eukaryotic-like serine/threonine-protein kinase
MFRHDPAHIGVYDSQPPSLKTIKWRFDTHAKILSSPAVANDVVYVGSFDGKLYAVNAQTGAAVWSFQTDGPVNSSPAVDNGTVYFSSLDGNVYAVDAGTGNAGASKRRANGASRLPAFTAFNPRRS